MSIWAPNDNGANGPTPTQGRRNPIDSGGGFGFGGGSASDVFSAASSQNSNFWDGIRSVWGSLLSDNYGTAASSAATDNGIGPNLFDGAFIFREFLANPAGQLPTVAAWFANSWAWLLGIVLLLALLSGGKKKGKRQ